MMLRIQRERMGAGLFPTLREYSKLFGLNADRLKMARPDVLIMHPGPINRGVEIAPDVADGPLLDDPGPGGTNGVAVRMARSYLLGGRQDRAPMERCASCVERSRRSSTAVQWLAESPEPVSGTERP